MLKAAVPDRLKRVENGLPSKIMVLPFCDQEQRADAPRPEQ
jgi:hypothetical protein